MQGKTIIIKKAEPLRRADQSYRFRMPRLRVSADEGNDQVSGLWYPFA